MIQRTHYFFIISTLLFSTLLVLSISLHVTHGLQEDAIQNKVNFTRIVGLPDLSVVSEARYVRHRSLSDIFSFFGDSPSLSEYFPSTFVYHYTPNTHKLPSRIEP